MTRLSSVVRPVVRFGREGTFQQEVSSLLSATRGGPLTCHPIGESEDGRPLVGYVVGSGPKRVSLIAGSHSDEPVGPESLRALVRAFIIAPEKFVQYLEEYTFIIIPHVNPDGEARNSAWIDEWPRLEAYLRYSFRELPGRDIEFGYPEMRQENKAVSTFLRDHGPFAMHASLHGMGFSDGALLLIDQNWVDRTTGLAQSYVQLATKNGLRMHDHDRGGAKGFYYLGPGFTTTPRGDAMRTHFLSEGDPEMASKFHDSSMEFVRSLGGDPLCVVTELPLFVITELPDEEPEGRPLTYLKLKDALPQAKLAASNERPVEPFLGEFELSAIPTTQAMKMQLEVIDLALEAVSSEQ